MSLVPAATSNILRLWVTYGTEDAMRYEGKHLDRTGSEARRREGTRMMRNTIIALLEATILAGASSVVAYAVSQVLLQTYREIVLVADSRERERVADEAMGWEAEEPDNGISPLYIDHLMGQDRSWEKPRGDGEG